jgi:hypothetical protein
MEGRVDFRRRGPEGAEAISAGRHNFLTGQAEFSCLTER